MCTRGKAILEMRWCFHVLARLSRVGIGWMNQADVVGRNVYFSMGTSVHIWQVCSSRCPMRHGFFLKGWSLFPLLLLAVLLLCRCLLVGGWFFQHPAVWWDRKEEWGCSSSDQEKAREWLWLWRTKMNRLRLINSHMSLLKQLFAMSPLL